MAALCRDCLARALDAAPRCRACGSPRLVAHADLDRLAIAHVDCDAFYAAIEKRDDPRLVDLPVIVGGGKRGVVATCCYVARVHGVRSAMPMFKALKLCPDAVVIKPDMAKYAGVGRVVRRRMLELTPLVEPLSIDEAFLDLAGTEALHGAPPALVLARFAQCVERELGITVSIGLAPNKFLAKIASDLDKPRGFAVIGEGEAAAFLAPKPVSLIWGVGRVATESLARDGFRTIGDLQRAEPAELARRYGALGLRLAALAHGRDARAVDPRRDEKQVSAETTLDEDIADPARLRAILWRLAEKVAGRLKAKGVAGRTVTLKLKTTDFRIRTRARRLPDPTALAHRIDAAAGDLLRAECDGTRFRLVGVSVSDLGALADADPRDLVEPRREKEKAAEAALDALRARFGEAAIGSGRALRGQG
jgi:DNA polymerase-4